MSVSGKYLLIKEAVARTARACGRDPAAVQIVAVTKGHALQHVVPVLAEGCWDFGENRVPEALEKMAQAPAAVRWHLIGTLQKNKVRKVVGKFHLIHSVDSLELAEKISTVSGELGVQTKVLLQANTSGEAAKHGLDGAGWKAVFPQVMALPHLEVQGLMTMAPQTEDQAVVRRCFAALRELRAELEAMAGCSLPHLSMGMSGDWPIAIEEGATLLRIGTAIFA